MVRTVLYIVSHSVKFSAWLIWIDFYQWMIEWNKDNNVIITIKLLLNAGSLINAGVLSFCPRVELSPFNCRAIKCRPTLFFLFLLVLGSETAVLRQDRSQTGLDLGLGLIYFLSCFQHCARQDAVWHDNAEMKCNRHQPVSFRAKVQKQCQTLLVITFLTFFWQQVIFLITNTRVVTLTDEFFPVMHSCCCLTGFSVNILVLFPSLISTYRVYN